MKIIAELCQNHNGDVDLLGSMVSDASLNGADIIRVHDVEEHIKTRALISRVSTQYSGELHGC